MGSTTKNPPQDAQRKGPETLRALRDSLIEDLRNQSAEHEDTSSAKEDEPLAAEPPHGPGVTATEPPIHLERPEDKLPRAQTDYSPKVTSTEGAATVNPNQLRLQGDEGETAEPSQSTGTNIRATP